MFSFGTAPTYLLVVSIPLLFSIHLFFFLALFFTFNWVVKVILIGLILYLLWYSRKNAIIRVNFYEDVFEIIHFFGFKSFFNYKEIRVAQEYKQGFLPYEIIVVKLKSEKHKRKKVHFFCPNNKRSELDKFLEIKGVTIQPQQ